MLSANALRRLLIVPSAATLTLLILMVPGRLPLHAQEDRGRPYYDLGVFALEDGDLQGATANLLKALSFDPDDALYNQYLGRTYLRLENYREALRYLEKAKQTAPQLHGLDNDLGLVRFKTGEYAKAAKRFEAVAKQDETDVEARYYAGRSLFKQDRFSKALDYFTEVAAMSPALKANAWYYAGVCHARLLEPEAAREKFTFVQANADSAVLRQYAGRWLENLATGKFAKKRYTIYLKAGGQYDSNAVLESPEGDTPEGKEDWVGKLFLALSYDFVKQHDREIGAGYSHYQTWHDEHSELDLIGSIFSIYGKYRWEDFTLGLTYLPSYYHLDSEIFLKRHQIRPEIGWRAGDNWYTRLSYSYFDNDYDNNDSDGHTHEVDLDVYYILGGKRGYLFAGSSFEDNTATAPDKFYEQAKARIGVSFNLPWDVEMGISGRYYHKDYNKIDRTDEKYNALFKLSRGIFYEWLELLAEVDYTKNDSDVALFEYERTTASLSLVTKF